MARNQQSVRVEVELSADQVEALDEAIQSGQFSTRAEALADAVDDWKLARSVAIPDAELKRLCDEGLASGDFQLADEVFERLREKITERLSDG